MFYRKCNKCGIKKPHNEFNRRSKNNPKSRSVCKNCVRKSYQDNKVEISKRNREYKKVNRESIQITLHSYKD